MTRPQRLFDITVVHGYFADPARCRLRFVADAATAAWAARVEGAFRGVANGLTVFCAAERAPGGARGPAMATTLRFGVYPENPLFGNFTAPWPAATGRATPVYELAPAVATYDTAVLSQAAAADTGAWAPPAFEVHVEVPPVPQAPPRYRIEIQPRALIWRYLLDDAAWREADPCIVVPTPGGAAAPVAGPFEPGARTILANGRDAIVLESREPLPLVDRGQRFELWSQREGRLGRRLLASLPLPSPADLARRGDAGPATMCEIIVPTLQ